MPCNIGYKNISRIRVEPKLPQEFKEKVEAPKLDENLLNNLGVEDTVFLEWISDLNIDPLLSEALKRALKVSDDTGKAEFLIKNGNLEISFKFNTAREKGKLEAMARRVSERFQMELLGIIAQLLDYKFSIFEQVADGKKVSILEGEKEENASIHKYLKVSIGNNGEGVLAFEHFESQLSLKQERAKFLTLAQKFGIKVRFSEEWESGQPIPSNIEHRDFLRQR